MSELLHVSSSPHVGSRVKTDYIMLMVVIALLPASIFGVYTFGFRALMLIIISITVCVLTEYIYEKLMKLPVTVGDFSAVLTGLLLALNLPPAVSWWIPVIGGVFAILIVKQLFGGLGQNIMNPALAARCFLTISFAGQMTDFSVPGSATGALDAMSGATPLQALKAGESIDVINMFTGNIRGTIGEVSVIALLAGAVFLLCLRIINLRIPLTYLATTVIFALLFGGRGLDINYMLGHLFGGGLMLGAWFMATDYVTCPITKKGQIVYGIVLGILTGIFRVFGGTAEGVSYAIIFGNLLVPLIERVTVPSPFGLEKGGKQNG